ncbi:MAG: CheR family methyltransferase [Nitrospiria bacterium]
MISPEAVKFFLTLLRKESGLALDESKKYLLETRLDPLAAQQGYSSIDDLHMALKSTNNMLLRQEVVDAMTTNETSFFRDRKPFDIFRDEVVPELIKRNAASRQIRIWCAACSTGQEPYSLAMELSSIREKNPGWKISILGTDITEAVLKKAREGIYSQHDVQRGLPTAYLIRFFKQSGMNWVVNPDLKRMVEFKRLNLLSNFTWMGKFDVVFCRNILIYFDPPTKKAVIERIGGLLPPHGVLFLGGSETLLGIDSIFTRAGGIAGKYYSKKEAPATVR